MEDCAKICWFGPQWGGRGGRTLRRKMDVHPPEELCYGNQVTPRDIASRNKSMTLT